MTAIRWQLLLLAYPAVLLGTIAVASPGAAGSFKVNPVNLTIPPDRKTTSLSITNSAKEKVSVRVVTYRWTQVDGRDLQEETTDVIVSPPIFTLEPAKTQLVRVGVKERRAGEAYRVVFEEIPHQQVHANTVQVSLRLDLPLFVEAGDAEPAITWNAWREDAGTITLEAFNTGDRHQRVLTIGLDDTTDPESLLTREMGVVLPKSSRRWLIGKQVRFIPGSTVTLVVRNPKGADEHSVVVQQR
jgi:fimbrial chaperone protein